jgi:hypothetical protein
MPLPDDTHALVSDKALVRRLREPGCATAGCTI